MVLTLAFGITQNKAMPRVCAQHHIFSKPSLSQGRHFSSPDHFSHYILQDPSWSDLSNLLGLESSKPSILM